LSKKRGRRQVRDGRSIPDWARRQRESDLGWIVENHHVFWPAARQHYQAHGRGALVVDTTIQAAPGAGHPFAYYTQAQLSGTDEADAQRMVQAYDPQTEMVIVLLKPQERVSVYRVQVIQS
jgi:hypothetical protein